MYRFNLDKLHISVLAKNSDHRSFYKYFVQITIATFIGWLLKLGCFWTTCLRRTGGWLQMNRLSLRYNRFEVRNFMRSTDRFRGIYGVYLKWIKPNGKMPTCNRFDLESLGSWPTMSKLVNFPSSDLTTNNFV
jgi:hypothetical protein